MLTGRLRFKRGEAQMGGPAGGHGYLAIYEIDGDPAAALDALKAARPTLQMTDALDRTSTLALSFGAITDKVTAG